MSPDYIIRTLSAPVCPDRLATPFSWICGSPSTAGIPRCRRRPRRGHPRDDPREDVRVGVVECELYRNAPTDRRFAGPYIRLFTRDAMPARYMLLSCRMCVCLSVCLSVTPRYCNQTDARIELFFAYSFSSTYHTLCSRDMRESTNKGVDLTGLLEDWGSEDPSGIQEHSPGRGSGGRSPPEAEAFFVKLHIIFALKYNKQQLLSLDSTSKTTSLLKYWGALPWMPPAHKYWGDISPCPIGIDAPVYKRHLSACY